MFMDASFLPSELIATPQPLIGFCGLDINKNPIHKSIWDAFSNNRKPDRVAIQFKLLPQHYDFPVLKPKRQSYEWYHPKGILKRNWILKHLHVLPAVVVLFQDIEWNDPQWTDKQLQCASFVQTLKNSLQGRNTRLAVVLLQKGAPLPSGEDLLASERAANLTSKCDISAKMLFVLPHNDHLMGYTLRLESAFLELAQSYYAQMARQVRLHRDQLTESHQNLKIRHLFKLGFISEMRMDFTNALKHYTVAYSSLEDIRIVDTNCLEIKVVAGFINYKICKLMFKSNLPKDSITQFRMHIERYKNRAGFKELRFEHFAWLSVQNNAFAELFCEAIKNGLAASQTQHPGIYYQKSAEYIGKRKEAFFECCALSMSPTEPLPPSMVNLLYSDFFGVRGTKTSEPVTEQQIICLVQENEKTFNHSAASITLMGQAMAQYKANKCLRFRKKLAIDMADEYLKSGDHSKALTLYSLMLSDYRIDKWYNIFTEVILKTLRSAYLSASVSDFISCSIEIMSNKINIDKTERIKLLENLWKVFQNLPPVSKSQITPELKINWENSLTNFNTIIILDLDKISKLFDCKLTFMKSQIKYDENIQLELYIKSNTNVPFKLKNFICILTDTKTNYKIIAKEYEELKTNLQCTTNEKILIEDDLLLEPDKCYKIMFYGEQYQFMENVELQILRLEIQIGSNTRYAILTQSTTLNKTKLFKAYNPHKDYMDEIKINNLCYIIPTFHLTTAINQTAQPMLVNEYFKVETCINNTFDVCLQNVGVSVTIPPNLRNKVFLATDLTKNQQKLLSNIQIDIGDLQIQSNGNIIYYLISLIDGNIELLQKIWYQTENVHLIKSTTTSSVNKQQITNNMIQYESPFQTQQSQTIKLMDRSRKKLLNSHNIKIDYHNENIKKYKEDIIIIPCVEEIHLNGKFYTLSRQALMRAYKNEDFLLKINLEIKSACSIDILDTYFISDHNILEKPYSGQKKLFGKNYKKGDKLEDILILNPLNTTIEWITKTDYNEIKEQKIIFKNHNSNLNNSGLIKTTNMNNNNSKMDELYNKNLLSKLPTNSTIIGNTSLISSQMFNLNITDNDNKLMMNKQQQFIGGISSSDDFLTTMKNDDLMSTSQQLQQQQQQIKQQQNQLMILNNKIIYNNTIDSIELTNGKRGFFKTNTITDTSANLANSSFHPIYGVYCIKWRRSGCTEENESKFVINGIEIIEPSLNLYCYFDEKLYVRTPMKFKVLIKNSSHKIIHLQAILNNSDSFMFAGHKQVNISLFSHSTFELLFNLYPLKLGWQPLPELLLEYNNQYDPDKRDEQLQIELNNLVKRWMPKSVFILPPSKCIK